MAYQTSFLWCLLLVVISSAMCSDPPLAQSSSNDVTGRQTGQNGALVVLSGVLVFLFLALPAIIVFISTGRSLLNNANLARSADDDLASKFIQGRYSRHMKYERDVAGTGISKQHLDNMLEIVKLVDKSLIAYNANK